MKKQLSTKGAAAVLVIVGVVAHLTPDSTAETPQGLSLVADSFARELSHEPGPAAPIRRESIEQDELYEALNQVHWTTEFDVKPATTMEPNPPGGSNNEELNDQ